MTQSATNNIITELFQKLPAKVRFAVYAVLAVASLVYGIYQAAGGDWKATIIALFTLLVGATAGSNVDLS